MKIMNTMMMMIIIIVILSDQPHDFISGSVGGSADRIDKWCDVWWLVSVSINNLILGNDR